MTRPSNQTVIQDEARRKKITDRSKFLIPLALCRVTHAFMEHANALYENPFFHSMFCARYHIFYPYFLCRVRTVTHFKLNQCVFSASGMWIE